MVPKPRVSTPPPARNDEWFATNGLLAIGPVPLEAIVREVREGRLYSSTSVRHASWRLWLPLEEVDHLTANELRALVRQVRERSVPPPAPSSEEPPASVSYQVPPSSEPPPRSAIRKVAINPVGVLSNTATIEEACLLALATATTACSAHVSVLWQWDPVLEEAHAASSLGSGTEFLLGQRLPPTDPVVRCAQQNRTVLGEPSPGTVGQTMANRLRLGQLPPVGLAMVPIVRSGQLVAFFELGQRLRPLTAREVGRVEDVAEILLERIQVQGWLE